MFATLQRVKIVSGDYTGFVGKVEIYNGGNWITVRLDDYKGNSYGLREFHIANVREEGANEASDAA